ncbi:MAG: hypothetical protein ACK5P7_12400 [Bdellovibrio sp.]|jgi:hypothetical protein
MEEKKNCVCCQKSKALLNCGVCDETVCKYCAHFLDEGQFSFLAKVPSLLSHSTYCPSCYDQNVAAPLQDYNQAMAQAKDILVFEKKQGKETRLIKRLEEPVTVTDCPDPAETVLRLAFFAVKAGYNAIVDVQVKHEKVKNGSYQTMRWSGTGVPAYVNEAKLAKDRSAWQNPN